MSQARVRVGRVLAAGSAALLAAAGVIALGAAPASAAATTRYVATTGNDGTTDSPNVCAAKAKPCKTIQHAVDVAKNGDTVSIGAGTFKESVGVSSLSLTVTGSTKGTTTIVGDDGPAIYFVNDSDGGATPVDTLTHVTASASTGEIENGLGVGIDDATVSISDSTMTGNAGGGIELRSGRLTLSNSTVTHNQAFGILAEGGTLKVSHSSIDDNRPLAGQESELGGGVGIFAGGAVSVADSSVSDNGLVGILIEALSDGGTPSGDLSVLRSSVSDNAFIGIAAEAATVAVGNSTLDGNAGAGTYTLGGTVAITNSTIADTKPYTGSEGQLPAQAGIDTLDGSEGVPGPSGSAGPAARPKAHTKGTSLFSSLPTSSGKADWAADSGAKHTDGAAEQVIRQAPQPQDTTTTGPSPSTTTITLAGTILANSAVPDCSATVEDHGYNLSSDKDNSCELSAAKHSLPKTDPELGTLAVNGGPTQTMQPDADSPVIDAIPVGDAGCVSGATDQRGIARPQGARCDIGALETSGIVISPNSLPAATVGKAYKVTFTATGGADSNYVWSPAPGSTLPTGLTLTKGGVLSGTPTKSGTFTFTVSVNDPVLKKYTLRIAAAAAAPHSPAASGSGSQLAATGANAQPLTQWGVGLLLGGLLLLSAGWIRRSRGRHVA